MVELQLSKLPVASSSLAARFFPVLTFLLLSLPAQGCGGASLSFQSHRISQRGINNAAMPRSGGGISHHYVGEHRILPGNSSACPAQVWEWDIFCEQ